jgi:hypothetical protein
MKWEDLVKIVSEEPCFPSAMLLAGDASGGQTALQLSRWVKAGRLLQLRRGLYMLAPPWRKVEPHPFVLANRVQRGSYVSAQSALSFNGMIPEHVPVVTSVGPGRPETVRTPVGVFQFHHLTSKLLFGYSLLEVDARQSAFVASPEKALLDLVHLTPGSDSEAYIRELRLQNLGALNPDQLLRFAAQSGKAKLIRAARLICRISTDGEEKL